MSSITKTLPKLRRHPEAMYARFADLPCAVSLEIADNFIVDFSPDDDVVGLEILWDDADRAGAEPALLAFGMFASAVVWRGYNHSEHSGQNILGAVFRKVKGFIAATDLPLQVGFSRNTGLTIEDEDSKLLLCADLQYYPQNVPKSGHTQERKSPLELLDVEVGRIRSAIDNLAETALPDNPGAIGVAVFVDASGALRYREPIAPGKWVTWPEAAKYVWTHIAIIPPHAGAYPWLPDGFISTQT